MFARMGRHAKLLRHIDRSAKGIEIAPFFRPLVSRRDGYDAEVLDVLDQQALLAHARAHPDMGEAVCATIDPVDHVMSANDLGDIGEDRYDYVISSHNFEHLPNPVKFLQGAQKVLKPGGVLTMAVPDFRRSLDRFRQPTLAGDWIEAFRENRTEIPARQGFETIAYLAHEGSAPRLTGDLQAAYDDWDHAGYRDIHISVFCPASLELLLREMQALGLLWMTVLSVESFRWEIHVHLRNTPPDKFDVHAERERLLKRMRKEMRQSLPPILRAANVYGQLKRRFR